jgi:hypothetical protein
MRLDNALSSLKDRHERISNKLETIIAQMATAKEEILKPFVHEEKLKELTLKLNELNIQLSMDMNSEKEEDCEVSESSTENTRASKKKRVLRITKRFNGALLRLNHSLNEELPLAVQQGLFLCEHLSGKRVAPATFFLHLLYSYSIMDLLNLFSAVFERTFIGVVKDY